MPVGQQRVQRLEQVQIQLRQVMREAHGPLHRMRALPAQAARPCGRRVDEIKFRS
jgi:hypothetical protein